MSDDRDWARRKIEGALILFILLLSWYIARPHPANGPREILHWVVAALAAYSLGASAWTIISKPSRILLALGYLAFGAAMSLQFIGDLAPPTQLTRIGWASLAALYVGVALIWVDHKRLER